MGNLFATQRSEATSRPLQGTVGAPSEWVNPRWVTLLKGVFTTSANMPCHHPSPPFGRSAWRVCNDLGVLRQPQFSIGKRTGPPDEGCLVVSIGIGGSWELEDRLASYGCAVHAYDPTFELQKRHASHVFSKPRMHFHFLGLSGNKKQAAGLYGAVASEQLRPLDELFEVARAGRLRTVVDVLKIDCEVRVHMCTRPTCQPHLSDGALTALAVALPLPDHLFRALVSFGSSRVANGMLLLTSPSEHPRYLRMSRTF